MKGDRFEEDRLKYHIHAIDEGGLELVGGGDFYEHRGDDPDHETWEEARKLAEKYGKRIIHAYGEWEGWSEYTPDPGDISVFEWVDK